MSKSKSSHQPEKKNLAMRQRMLLRYEISERDREPDLEKIAVIDGLSASTNAKGIAKLLGHVDWYWELTHDTQDRISYYEITKEGC